MRAAVRFRHLAAVAAMVLPLAIGATGARADLVSEPRRDPPCTAPGQPCLTDLEAEPGTCVATTCTRQVRMRDGSTTPVGVPCFECKAGAKGPTPPPKSKSSGCAVAPDPGDAVPLAVTVSLVAGWLVLAARRRRSDPSP